MSLLSFIVGAATGLLSGFGIGGGSLLVLYLTTLGGVEQAVAGGINLLYFIGCAPAALIGHIKQKMIQWNCATWCIIGGIPTAITVSFLAQEIETDLLRRLFGIFLICIGIKEWKVAKQTK